LLGIEHGDICLAKPGEELLDVVVDFVGGGDD
jgi:hypothetical protein